MSELRRNGPHDVAGLAGGPVDRHEHDPAHWEKQVDAMMTLLGEKGHLKVDELRRGIESLGPEAYERLGYYERWAESLRRVVTERGLVTPDELERRIAEMRE